MYHHIKAKIPENVVFGQNMIIPIAHIADWKYTHQQKQAQVEKYVIKMKSTIIHHDYRVRYQVTIIRTSVFKYETPF